MLLAMTESELFHSLKDEGQSKGLGFCFVKLQQQHSAVPSTAADLGLEHWK